MSKIAYDFTDSFKDLKYDYRVLDALASFLHFQGPASAVMLYDKKLYVSYNSEVTEQTKTRIQLVQKVLQNLKTYDQDYVLGVYLIFNSDFKELVGTNKLTIKQYSKLCFELLENFGKQFSTVRQKLGKNSTELDYAVKKAINDPLSFTNLIEPFTSTYKKMLSILAAKLHNFI
ncbi:hypothetical protein [Candidatus Tisiphia endosymbiont of Micropterix aruncella]|uniref:hypothetical protein n=1 Tax=Candidatus Tisiphia endosymbiont of Micropterix aruncella TaxID=3066271 RepID=UPI003AA8E15A